MTAEKPVLIVGAGFTGLACAHALVKAGHHVVVCEADDDIGGLAGSFPVDGVTLEKFYHHWFLSDSYVLDLVKELGLEDAIVRRPTRTGMYYAEHFYRLSSPLDLMRFSPLSFADRLRLGFGTIAARLVRDWHTIEHLTAREWLLRLFGAEVFRVVWEPLLVGKFGPYADRVGAVWFWKKLVLRGGTRSKSGAEMLAYLRGGFALLAERLAEDIRARGGEIRTGCRVRSIVGGPDGVAAVETDQGRLKAAAVVATPAPAIVADLADGLLPADRIAGLRAIEYLGNVCLVLRLDRSLSDTYWLNVNDAEFPFVGIIEHTNFEPADAYGGEHIVYMSRYCPASDPLYAESDAGVLDFALPHIRRMFPQFDTGWIKGCSVWRAAYAQPIAVPGYSRLVPPLDSGIPGLFLANMAQIYPEDRGTNYAVREGLRAAEAVRAFVGAPGAAGTAA